MAELIAKSPCAGLLPLTVGALSLTEVQPGPMTAIAPFHGQAGPVGQALTALGLEWPGPGMTQTAGAARIVWFGHSHALLIGVAAPAVLADHAALTDQSDAWACVRLQGTGAAAALARLTPLDLRSDRFGIGDTARTELFHMAAAITRTAEDGFEVMVFRSMAATLVHDLKAAMQAVTARTTG